MSENSPAARALDGSLRGKLPTLVRVEQQQQKLLVVISGRGRFPKKLVPTSFEGLTVEMVRASKFATA